MNKIQIGNREISETAPCFIIAELSANHNQDYKIAEETIYAAKEAGADAVKLQTYTPDTITLDSDKEYFQIKQGTIWDGMTLYKLYQTAYTPWEWHSDLKDLANKLGMELFSSPFDFSAVDFLEELDIPAYKIASFEITDIPLIEYVAKKGKPVIISTGVAAKDDIELAINTCKQVGNDSIVLLKCTSSYPAPLEEANLKMIPDFQKKFNVIPGLSDHTLGVTVPIAAVALGAKVIEKHFIIDKSIGGPDVAFSLDKKEFSEMVNAVREVEKSLGVVDYNLSEKAKNSRHFSRSLFVAKDVKKGEVFTKDNIKSVRPGNGLHPKYYQEILGKFSQNDIERGTPLQWEHIK